MLNILFVTQNYPYPGVTHGGGQDFWHMIDFMRHRHRIYVLTFDDPVHPVAEDALRPYVQDLRVIRYATTLHQKVTTAGVALATGYRFAMPRRVWEMRRLVSQWLRRYAINVLHCGWTEMGACLDLAPAQTVRVLDEVDVRFYLEEYAVAAGTLKMKVVSKNKALELNYCRQADFVITRSFADRAVLHAHIPNLDVLVVPPVAHTRRLLSAAFTFPKRSEVLFAGAMSRAANQQAAIWFVRQVWPYIRKQVPDAILRIVGADPAENVLQLAHEPGVQVSGYVPDICPYYEQASVVIAPMHTPSGQLNKVMDGLAAGRPVVATSLANRGTSAPCVITADTADDFAAAVIRLLTDQDWWRETAQVSRHFAETHFSWQVDELEARYEYYLRQRQL